MKFISTKQTLISFTVFLTILALGSCSVADDTAPPGGSTAFQQDIENAITVPNFTTAKSPLTREVLTPLGASASATLEKRYVTETGGGSYNGSSWTDAWAATNLRNGINAITNATAGRVYLVMVAGGTYKPTYTTSRGDSFSMTNHVAIMGGFQTGGGWGRTGTTIFSGDIGTVGSTNDNSYHVFFHNNITLGNTHLYGVTITGGNANGAGTQQNGGGMYNFNSPPLTLTWVVFSGNSANDGGGMYNSSSSPVVRNTVFSGNSANDGGGMYNTISSPILTGVIFNGNNATRGTGMYNDRSSPFIINSVFSGNNANDGGGMYNSSSSPILTSVTFIGNTATSDGGGIYNSSSSPKLDNMVFSRNTAIDDGGGMFNGGSSPVIIGAVFRNNRAADGGGMWNDNGGEVGPLIVNTIFSGNTLSGAGSGPNIAVNRGGATGAESIRIAGSVLGLGLAHPTNHIVGFGGSAVLNITYHSLANGAVTFGADANLTMNGMNLTYPTITGGSAVNLGLHVRKHVNGTATTYYFSETGTGTSWYTGFTSTGAGGLVAPAVDLPTTGTIEDLTATDIAGNARNARPDAGVYEVQ